MAVLEKTARSINPVAEGVIGDETITTLVNDARSLWQSGQDNRLKLGEKFSQLYHAVERYKKSTKTGLTYNGTVEKTTVPRSTAERLREMWETKEEYSIPADTFLLLCEEGANLAAIKAKLGAAFKGAISTFLPKIQCVDPTDAKAVTALATDLGRLVPKPAGEADLAELETQLSDLTDQLPRASGEEAADLAEEMHQTREQIGVLQVDRMKALVTALAPFLDWPDERVKQYMRAFADQPLSQRARLYREAAKFAKSAATGLAITTTAAV
jgi:hypothetical protein